MSPSSLAGAKPNANPLAIPSPSGGVVPAA